jgi:protein-L-isoaspartate(D-aspartate) O-methyltransferase
VTDDEIAVARRWFAEELRHVARVRSPAVVDAFASVPREHFAGPGPWRLLSPWYLRDYWTTQDADPRHLCHDVLVAIDEARRLNNGQPSLWAFLYDQLDLGGGDHVMHVGIGTGYYSAILAHIVGHSGAVTAVEIDPVLAARAQANLTRDWPQAHVVTADGFAFRPERPADAIIVNAGVTHLSLAWLDALNESGGRLLVPLTNANRAGGFVLITRREGATPRYDARHVCGTGLIGCVGGRDDEAEGRLIAAIAKSGFASIRSLRRRRMNRTRPAGSRASPGGCRLLRSTCEDQPCCSCGPTANTATRTFRHARLTPAYAATNARFARAASRRCCSTSARTAVAGSCRGRSARLPSGAPVCVSAGSPLRHSAST